MTESYYIEGRRLLDATMRLGGTVGLAAMRPAAGAVSAGLRLERAARGAAGPAPERRRPHGARRRPRLPGRRGGGRPGDGERLARHAVGRAFEGPLVDVIAEDLVRYAVVERIVDRLLADGIVEHIVDRVLDGPELERVVGTVLESPAIERLVGQTIESRLADHAVARLLDSEELWLLVEEIAESPAVTDAITQQGFGFADEVAGGRAGTLP